VATRIVTILVLGLAGGLVVWNVSGSPLRGAGVDLARSAAPDNRLWRGVNSCSAASCHGGGHPGSKGSEQTTWAACDPHARAYEVLFEERSKQIVKNYF